MDAIHFTLRNISDFQTPFWSSLAARFSEKMSNCIIHSYSKANEDQYADGIAASIWNMYIGNKDSRLSNYREFLVNLLKSKGCKTVLDVACGTGIDSVMLLEEGFKVTSTDASYNMLKHAFKIRWQRRKEEAFDNWVIEKANWLTLTNDIAEIIGSGFDAIICLGSSFSMLLDPTQDGQNQRTAMRNFEKCLKPGGLFIIDHRNYDHFLQNGHNSIKCMYYNSEYKVDIKEAKLNDGVSNAVSLDYTIYHPALAIKTKSVHRGAIECTSNFCLTYIPHKLSSFTGMLKEAFGSGSVHTLYGDYKPLNHNSNPEIYIHIMEKAF